MQKRKQVGCTVDVELYKRLRAQAVQEDRQTGEVLDDAIRLYLEKKAGKSEGSRA